MAIIIDLATQQNYHYNYSLAFECFDIALVAVTSIHMAAVQYGKDLMTHVLV